MKVARPRLRRRDLDLARHGPDLLLEGEGDIARLARQIEEAEQHRRADRRVAGEGQLPPGREDAQRGAVAGILGRADEHRLGEVELARDRLHAAIIEALGIEHHGELVAGERLAREHIERVEAAGHGGPFGSAGGGVWRLGSD